MAFEIVSGRVEYLRRGSQYVARSFFNILSSSRSASSICEDFRDPLATLLTKEGLTFNLLAILAYTPAKADMIFPGVRPTDPGYSGIGDFSWRAIAFIVDTEPRGNAISSLMLASAALLSFSRMLLVSFDSYYRLAPADTVPFSTSTSDVGLLGKYSERLPAKSFFS
jgi:hypothetical protein